MQQIFSILSRRLFTAQHVSGVFPPIIRSSMTAVAASWQPLVLPSYRGGSRAVFMVGPAGQDNKLKNCCIRLVIYLN